MSRLPILLSDGEKYEILEPFETSYDGESDYLTFTAENMKRVVILCEHCKNFRLDPVVVHSFDQVIELGWIRKIEETNEPENTRPST